MRPKRSNRRQATAPRIRPEPSSTADTPKELGPEEAKRLQEYLLERMAQGATLCRDIEAQLRQHPAPELETIIKVFRLLVLKLSAEVRAMPELRHLVSTLIKPVMDWARLEEQRKRRELAQERHREESAARKAAAETVQNGREQALRPETLEKIERELNLF